MTTTRTPVGPSAGGGTDPGPQDHGPGIAGVGVRLTAGGYVLVVAVLLVSGLSLPVAAPGWAPAAYLAAAAAVVLLFLISMVLHELPGPGAQWRIAAAGPAAGLAMAGLCAAAAAGLSALAAGPLTVLARTTAAWLNGLLGVFSGLPGAGPDGGRIVRALTWARPGDPARASLVAARAGQITGQAFLDGDGDGRRPGLAGAPSAVPVRDFDGGPAGVPTLSQIAAVPPDRRDAVRLSDMATPLAQIVTTSPGEPMQLLLGRLRVRPASPAAWHTAGHALVLHAGGSAVGVLTPADFARASQPGALRTNRGKAAGR